MTIKIIEGKIIEAEKNLRLWQYKLKRIESKNEIKIETDEVKSSLKPRQSKLHTIIETIECIETMYNNTSIYTMFQIIVYC